MVQIDTLVPQYGPFDLHSATVLITGGSSGIGLGLASEFIKAGSTVIITGRREGPLKEAQAKYPKLHYQVNDVSKAEERQKLTQWAIKEFPQLNVLVNNAGIQVSEIYRHTCWLRQQWIHASFLSVHNLRVPKN